jgi:SAM-dependent methyltransferase
MPGFVIGRAYPPLAARARIVVDVGSGHGHMTRDLADRIPAPIRGLERDPSLADRARALSSGMPGTSPDFAVTDVLRDGLALSEGDCVVGLHACGELGDLMVASVARCRSATVALVGCCAQKRRQPTRAPLFTDAGLSEGLELPRALLGLSNLAAGDDGVEATRAENLAARERRLALNRLLSDGLPPLRLLSPTG